MITTFDVGDKIHFMRDGELTVGIIESVRYEAIKIQTEWPLRYHPETGMVKHRILSEQYTLKLRDGIFTKEQLHKHEN